MMEETKLIKRKERQPPTTTEQRVTMVFALICLIMMGMLLWYVLNNIELLTTSPCKVCETVREGMSCSYIPNMFENLN